MDEGTSLDEATRGFAKTWRALRGHAGVVLVALTVGVAGTIVVVRAVGSPGGPENLVHAGSLTRDGWTLSVPSTWHVQTVPPCTDSHQPSWIVVTNTTYTFTGRDGSSLVCAQGPSLAGFPADGVALAVWPLGGMSGFARATSSMPLPLTQDLLRPTGGIRGGPQQSFALVGDFSVTTWTGEGASATARKGLARVLESVRITGATTWTTAHEGGFSFPLPSDWRAVTAEDTPGAFGRIAIESPPYGRVHGGTPCSRYPISGAARAAGGIAVWIGSPRSVSIGGSAGSMPVPTAVWGARRSCGYSFVLPFNLEVDDSRYEGRVLVGWPLGLDLSVKALVDHILGGLRVDR